MFFKVVLQKVVKVLPVDLSRTVNRQLERYLRNAVEGTHIPDVGLVLAIIDIHYSELLEGKVLDDGSVSFHMTYDALVFRLFRGEVVDAHVSSVVKDGFFASVGPGEVYVNRGQIPADYIFESDGVQGTFVLKDGSKSIRPNEAVRVRVVAETPHSDSAIGIGSVLGKYLGAF